MEIKLSSFSVSATSSVPDPSLSINLSRDELIDRRIAQIQDTKDRNYRRDMLRDTLSLKSAMKDLERLLKKGNKQVDTSADPVASSNKSLGLDTSESGDLSIAIDQVSSLSAISSGNIIVMGEQISIDVETDSINDIIDRINDSNAGVTASFNTLTNKLELIDSDSFIISNGTSNFFAGMGVTTGEIQSAEDDTRVSFFKSSNFLQVMNRFARKLNTFFQTSEAVSQNLGLVNAENSGGATLSDNPLALDIKTAVENAITSNYDEDFNGDGKVRFDFGLTFSFTTGHFVDFEPKEYEEKLAGQVSTMLDFFLTEQDESKQDEGGLLALLGKSIDALSADLQSKINSKATSGLLVDLEA